MKMYVWTLRNGGMTMHNGQWMDATELLSAMGVEVCATTASELSAENAELRKQNELLSVAVDDLKERFYDTMTKAQAAELRHRNDALLAQVDELTQTVANRDAEIASLEAQLERAITQRDWERLTIRNIAKEIATTRHTAEQVKP